MWLLCESPYPGSYLRRMQLRKFRGSLCYLRKSRSYRRLLLPWMRTTRKRSRWMSQDCEFRCHQDGFILRTKKVWIQKKIASIGVVWASLCVYIKRVRTTPIRNKSGEKTGAKYYYGCAKEVNWNCIRSWWNFKIGLPRLSIELALDLDSFTVLRNTPILYVLSLRRDLGSTLVAPYSYLMPQAASSSHQDSFSLFVLAACR